MAFRRAAAVVWVLFSGFVALEAVAAPPVFPGATPNYKARIYHLPGAPEGLAKDAQDRMYAAIFYQDEVVRLTDTGRGYEVVAIVPNAAVAKHGVLAGLTFGPQGQLYAVFIWNFSEAALADPLHLACHDPKDVYSGVYQVDVRTGVVIPFVTRGTGWLGCTPDDVTVDAGGDVYITDIALGVLWRATPNGKVVLWSKDPLLGWPPAPWGTWPIGGNDLTMDRDGKGILVGTDGEPMVIRVPIRDDGSAGPATVVARYIADVDGITLDDQGNIYVSEPDINEIIGFSQNGAKRRVIATVDTAPLLGPTSLVYRQGEICTANLNENGGRPEQEMGGTVTCISGFRRP